MAPVSIVELESPAVRLEFALDTGWTILLARIASGRTPINKESSMQLHYAAIVHSLGETLCTRPGEAFAVELESKLGDRNADMTCSLGEATAVIEMKCFRKTSNRATDTDMYDVLSDISRLGSYPGFTIRRLACLTDNPWYAEGSHSGHAGSVTIKGGTHHPMGTTIVPSWAGQWKDTSRNHPIHIATNVTFEWIKHNGWYSLYLTI